MKVINRLFSVTKKIYLLINLIVIMVLTGCVQTDTSYRNKQTISELSEHQAQIQTQHFFNEHLEYIETPSREAQLFDIFKIIMSEPRNRKLTMYQVLLLSHDKLKQLDDSKKNKDFSS